MVEEIIGRLSELAGPQIGRLEDELRRERKRRASSAGGGRDAPASRRVPRRPSRKSWSTVPALLAKRQKSDDNHCQQYRGPIQNLGPQVVIVAKQFEVRLRDQQHRIDPDSEDHEIREDVQAFEVD